MLPQLRLAGPSALLVRLNINMVLIAACCTSYSTSSLRVSFFSSLPQDAKVPGITGWNLYHGTYEGVACDNNAEVKWPLVRG